MFRVVTMCRRSQLAAANGCRDLRVRAKPFPPSAGHPVFPKRKTLSDLSSKLTGRPAECQAEFSRRYSQRNGFGCRARDVAAGQRVLELLGKTRGYEDENLQK